VLKHPTATISPAIEAGAGTIFEAKTIVSPAVKIGKGVILASASIIEHGAVIGDYSLVEAGTIIRKGAVVKAGVRVNNANANEIDESHFREGERNG
jgi:UDP-3-O-[3-hydroxymyristoyl] glucosamine N-acyltransferase